MPAKLTQTEFLIRCKEVHGNKYNLAHIEYLGGKEKIKVECLIHGFFYPPADAFMRGTGCKGCGYSNNGKNKQYSFEEFKKDASEKHNGKFCYDHIGVGWIGTKTKFNLFCPVHQRWFNTTAYTHSKGRDCPSCAKIAGGIKNRGNTEKFISEGVVRFGNRFDYSKVNYIKSNLKVDIRCIKHDQWLSVTPNMHLSGLGGCQICANEATSERCKKTTGQFITEARQIHGSKYSYDRVVYAGIIENVEVYCQEHGYFWQLASVHLSGGGCPNCAENGYKNTKEGFLYVLYDNDLTKVGITNKTVEERSRFISNDSGRPFKIVAAYQFGDGKIPQDIEKEVLKELRQKYNQPTERFSGATECFYNVNLPQLLHRIESLIKEQNSSNNQAAQAA